MNPEAPLPSPAIALRRLTMRQTLQLAFALLLLLVTAILLVASYIGTRALAGKQAEALMAGVRHETEGRLQDIVDPIRQRLIEDYAAIRIGRYTTKDPVGLKDRLYLNLFALPHVDSLMIGDLTGSQFLVMRYTPAVVASPVLAPIADTLPAPPAGTSLQFFTRDFRPTEWGESSRWTLWDEDGRTPLRNWELPLAGYDGRQRPWHKAAMAKFADLPLDEARDAGDNLVAWTDVYPLFTTKKPCISAAIAARDPAGRVLIVAYDLLLDEIARFSSTTSPSLHGQLFVITDDGRLLGPPRDDRPDAALRRSGALIQPIAEADYPAAAETVAVWRNEHGGAAGQFRRRIGGAVSWVGFSSFSVGTGQNLWIGVLVPESDLIPAAQAHQHMILLVGVLALALAAAAGGWLARRIAHPLTALTNQARRIAELDLGTAPAIQSSVTELATLARTIAETRESLRQRIAERENARLALAESEQQVRTLAENTPDIIVRFDQRGHHLFVNPAHTAATGLAPARVIGRGLHEAGYPEACVRLWRGVIDGVFATDRTAVVEFEYPTPHGPRHFEARVVPEPAGDPANRTALAVIHDISERVTAAAVLRHNETRYRTLIEAAPVAIIVHQADIVCFVNPAALQIFGYKDLAEAGPNPRWENYVDPAVRPELESRLAAALRGEPLPPHPGWQLLRSDGGRRWVQSSATSVEWDGRPALLTFLRDITDLRTAAERQTTLEEQLRHAQKLEAVGLLAGGIAHDFNNLLQIIGGNAQIAEHDRTGASDRRAALAEIGRTVQRASQMTRQLLAFSRRQALAREETDLNTFVADHVRMLRRLIPENIRFEFHPAPRPLVVDADRGQLEQVLLNLCLNARDAMPKGGTLTLRLEPVLLDPPAAERLGRTPGAPFARISVADTGHGMDKDTLDRIFDPFFTTKPRDKGTGLGLAVVYGIIRQHEGHIEATSQPGIGSEFVVHLPYLENRHTPAVCPHEPIPAAARPGATVLVAEDDEAIRRLACSALRHAGYSVIATEDGADAVERFRRDPSAVDLLFFDVMMPQLGGFEAARQCRAFRPEIPVVFASGYAADSVEEGESIPADVQVLQKPYRTDKFLQLVARLLASDRN